MKKIAYILTALMVLLASCEPIDKPEGDTPTGLGPDEQGTIEQELKFPERLYGDWHCESKSISATEIYVTFTADNHFTLYQKIQQGGFKVLNGTYTLTAIDGETSYLLSGIYNDGAAWGAEYTLESSDQNSFTLTAEGVTETYSRVEGGIPDEVKNGAETVVKSSSRILNSQPQYRWL